MASAPGGNKHVDFENANSAEFKKYVLYILPGEPNSQKALRMAEQCGDEVWVQDLRMLHPPLPSWLNGVPTLVPRSESKAYKGTDCLTYLQHMSSQPQGYMSGQTQSIARSFDSAGCVTRFESVSSHGSMESDRGDSSNRVGDEDLEAYMQRRSAQTEMFKQDPQANAIVAR